MTTTATGSEAPLWSVMIPTYNSEKYLRRTLQSVLADLPLTRAQIWVVDNGSTDDTEAIIKELGEEAIRFIRNGQNLGVMGNFNRCIELAKGQLVHILNSDDLVLPGFYSVYEAAFREHEDVYIVTSNAEIIDDSGKIIAITRPPTQLINPANTIEDFLYSNPVRTPSVVVRKSAYEQIGGFNTKLIQCGDWDMWTRVVNAFKGLHLDRVLTQYREHADNESSKVYLSGANILDTEQLYKLFAQRDYPIVKERYLRELSLTAYEQYLQLHFLRSTGVDVLEAIYKRLDAEYKNEASGAQRMLQSLRKFILRIRKTLKAKPAAA